MPLFVLQPLLTEWVLKSVFHISQDEDPFKYKKVVADPHLVVVGFSLCVDRKYIMKDIHSKFKNSF